MRNTDASTSALGAALYQMQYGQMWVVAYASQCEQKYLVHKLEFLSLKWAITDKFQDYLNGCEFRVRRIMRLKSRVRELTDADTIVDKAVLDATSQVHMVTNQQSSKNTHTFKHTWMKKM